MRTYKNGTFTRREGSLADLLHHDVQSELHRLWCELRKLRGGGRYANASATPSPYPGYFPAPPTQPPPASYCPSTTRLPCASLVSLPTETALRGQNRSGNYTATIAALAPAATVDFAFNAALTPGGSDTLTANSMWRTISLVDLIAPNAGLDDMQIDVIVAGIVRGTFNGGIFSRSNANACTPACGIVVCAGPLEGIVVRVTNQTGAPFGAAVGPAKLTTRTSYSGDAGFTCGDEGSCSTQVQVMQVEQECGPCSRGEG